MYAFLSLAVAMVLPLVLYARIAIRERYKILHGLPRRKWITLKTCKRQGFCEYWARLCIVELYRKNLDIDTRVSPRSKWLVDSQWPALHPLDLDTVDYFEIYLTGVGDSRGAFGFVLWSLFCRFYQKSQHQI